MNSTSYHDAYGSFPPDWSVGVMYAGVESCDPGHVWEGVRDHVVIHLVTAGDGTFTCGRRSYELGRGDLFVIHPQTYVHYQASATVPWTYRWIGYTGLHAVEFTDGVLTGRRRPVIHLPDWDTPARLLTECLEVLKDRNAASQLRATAKLYELLGEMRAQTAVRVPRRTDAAALVEEAQAFMEQNYHREIGVLDVARHIGVDRSHFSRVFGERTGESMQAYLIRVRMRKALHLLQESSLPVKAVAGSVGYRTYHSFARRFQQYYGRSPSRSRQEAPAASSSGRSVMRERSDSESNP